jgi:UDP-N-acetylmuramoylalanine--D-glutamate ligase
MIEIKNIVILGGAESGVGAAILAKKEGFTVFVSDKGIIAAHYKEELEQQEVEYEEGKHSVDRILNTADLVIKSPGIPDNVPLVLKLKEKGIEVIDELEFAVKYSEAKIIAITGSNGKTTVTKLVYNILSLGGLNVGLAGNIGFSFAKQVAEGDKDYYALEISSFQLDNMTNFNPDVAVLVNITPDHLDRYEYKIEDYIASKFRIVKNKGAEQVFIYNSDDKNIQYGFEHYYNGNQDLLMPISMEGLKQELEVFRVPHIDFEIPVSELTLRGRHNLFNIQCAVLAAKQFGVSNEVITKALQSFENEPHRLESVIFIENVEYINDSKATNVDAVYYALEAMEKPVVWIAGGIDKGNVYSQLYSLVKEKVRAIVCLGKDNAKLQEAFKGVHGIVVESRSMEEAIKIASLYAEPGDAVLLSPACSSFDLFQNYAARGDKFKEVLLQQHKIMTEGIEVVMNLNFKINPANNQSDD